MPGIKVVLDSKSEGRGGPKRPEPSRVWGCGRKRAILLRRQSNLSPTLIIRVTPKITAFPFIPKAADRKESLVMNALHPFAYRTNPDGSIDSICLTCFQTIACEDSQDRLIVHEESHSCDPYWVFSRAPVDFRQSTSGRASASRFGNVQEFRGR